MVKFVRNCGLALLIGGVLLILINTILTPMMLAIENEAAMRTSDVYLVRISLACVTALLFLFGCIGVHVAQRAAVGAFGSAAFLMAFIGSGMLLALEWSNLFVLRAVAQSAPQALDVLDEADLMSIGFASAAGLFALGWLLLAISTWLSKVLSRRAAMLVIAGFLLVPILAVTPLGPNGMIVGNVVLGLGFILLGHSVMKAASEVSNR